MKPTPYQQYQSLTLQFKEYAIASSDRSNGILSSLSSIQSAKVSLLADIDSLKLSLSSVESQQVRIETTEQGERRRECVNSFYITSLPIHSNVGSLRSVASLVAARRRREGGL